ncbi:MAG: 2-octaprenyl-6-methoxyphenyl hydroxylase [Endozoicomonadaceae bacterium]|nr:2-octaprenyl-6-methoxyphenyl hydroxylase [Endozoicomonadaceae bacterium]
MASSTEYDVVIIGGGMVGASLALSLRQSVPTLDFRIAVFEAVPLCPERLECQPSYDGRSSALSWGTRKIYESLGIWSSLADQVEPICHIHVSDRNHFGMTRLRATDYEVSALGYVVDNQWLGQVLLARIQETEGIDFLCPVEVRRLLPTSKGIDLEVNLDGRLCQISAGLVVMADGGRSSLGRNIGLEQSVSHYHQTAIITNITPDRHHGQVAYERFTDEGPMALLPLQKGRCALVWTMPDELAHQRIELTDKEFLKVLQERFGYRVGRFLKVGQRFSYPLALKLAREQIRPGLVVLGNAAHSLHPVAGQGFNLALRDVIALSATLMDALKAGIGIGELATLQTYLARQKLDQFQTIYFSDYVVQLFTENAVFSGKWLQGIRNIGLVTLDLCGPLKGWFARQAMGLGGR